MILVHICPQTEPIVSILLASFTPSQKSWTIPNIVIPGYKIPRCKTMDDYRQSIEGLPMFDSPETFGLHPNADITYVTALIGGYCYSKNGITQPNVHPWTVSCLFHALYRINFWKMCTLWGQIWAPKVWLHSPKYTFLSKCIIGAQFVRKYTYCQHFWKIYHLWKHFWLAQCFAWGRMHCHFVLVYNHSPFFWKYFLFFFLFINFFFLTFWGLGTKHFLS